MDHAFRFAPFLLLLTAAPQTTPAAKPAQETPAQSKEGATQPAAPADATFTKEQLEQLVAPIALHPDGLLSQILMASTYPLEIVEAQRWMEKTPGLTGTKLEEGLKGQDWDPSVKSLCGFPDVLKSLNENLDWTQDLGDAFLAQKSELMDAVQIMRGKAKESGNLETTKEQKVTQKEDKIIVIESTSPEVIYVPSYSPTVVYGSWGYPSYYYPSMYAPPPPGYGLMAFGVGVAWGAAVFGGCNWGWGHSDVDIDINRENNFNRNTNINGDRAGNRGSGSGGRGQWNHDSTHRKGVNYKNGATASKYGGTRGSNRVSSSQARGFSGSKPTASQRPAGGAAQRPAAGGASPGAAQRGGGAASGARASGTAYSGSRDSSSFDRASSSRGAASRGTTSYGGSSRSGGASRSGGGASRGGGGGRGGGRR